MRIFPALARAVLLGAVFLGCQFVRAETLLLGQQKAADPASPPVTAATPVLGARLSTIDPIAKRGLTELYNLEYDKAIADFERTVQTHPTDPFAVNYLLQSVVLKELYRLNALDTTLYADNGFLTGKPLPGDPKVKARIQELADQSQQLSEARLKSDPNDVDALYAHGVTRGLRLTYVAIVEKSFFAALKNALGARNDHERVLELDPKYINAKVIVGVHNFVIGSLPLPMRLLVGVAGIGGSKKKGLEFLAEVGASTVEASTDARAALALFLRREARYDEALVVAHSLSSQYPRNFVFALEEANLLKDAGKGPEAIDAYSRILSNGKAGNYADPHLERAAFGLAESLKGQHKAKPALDAYLAALSFPNIQPDLKLRALLGAAQMFDVLEDRTSALKNYRAVIALDSKSLHAELAKSYLKQPFKFPL